MILTQQALIKRLRSEGLRISPSTIHLAVEAGMPSIRVAHLKKPRFHWETVWAWLISNREADPLTQIVRDQILRQSKRGTG